MSSQRKSTAALLLLSGGLLSSGNENQIAGVQAANNDNIHRQNENWVLKTFIENIKNGKGYDGSENAKLTDCKAFGAQLNFQQSEGEGQGNEEGKSDGEIKVKIARIPEIDNEEIQLHQNNLKMWKCAKEIYQELIKAYRGGAEEEEGGDERAKLKAEMVEELLQERLKNLQEENQEKTELTDEEKKLTQEEETEIQNKVTQKIKDKMVNELLKKKKDAYLADPNHGEWTDDDNKLTEEEDNEVNEKIKALMENLLHNRKSLFQKFAELHVDYFIIAALYATQITYLLLTEDSGYNLATGEKTVDSRREDADLAKDNGKCKGLTEEGTEEIKGTEENKEEDTPAVQGTPASPKCEAVEHCLWQDETCMSKAKAAREKLALHYKHAPVAVQLKEVLHRSRKVYLQAYDEKMKEKDKDSKMSLWELWLKYAGDIETVEQKLGDEALQGMSEEQKDEAVTKEGRMGAWFHVLRKAGTVGADSSDTADEKFPQCIDSTSSEEEKTSADVWRFLPKRLASGSEEEKAHWEILRVLNDQNLNRKLWRREIDSGCSTMTLVRIIMLVDTKDPQKGGLITTVEVLNRKPEKWAARQDLLALNHVSKMANAAFNFKNKEGKAVGFEQEHLTAFDNEEEASLSDEEKVKREVGKAATESKKTDVLKNGANEERDLTSSTQTEATQAIEDAEPGEGQD